MVASFQMWLHFHLNRVYAQPKTPPQAQNHVQQSLAKLEIKQEKEPDATSFGVAEVQEQFQDRQPDPEMEIEYTIQPDSPAKQNDTGDDHENTGTQVDEPDDMSNWALDDPYHASGMNANGGTQDPTVPPEGPMNAEPSPTTGVSPPVPSQLPPSAAKDLEPGDHQPSGNRKRLAEVDDVAYQVKSFPPPVLTSGAIDSRLRRVFKARQDGTMLLDETWVQQWLDKDKRENIKAIFEKVGYNVDRVVKMVVLPLACILFGWML